MFFYPILVFSQKDSLFTKWRREQTKVLFYKLILLRVWPLASLLIYHMKPDLFKKQYFLHDIIKETFLSDLPFFLKENWKKLWSPILS